MRQVDASGSRESGKERRYLVTDQEEPVEVYYSLRVGGAPVTSVYAVRVTVLGARKMEESNSVQLSSLLHSLLHRAYHDLSVLSELLPRKTDVDKKIEIVQYARQTRLLLIRLLALVKWAGSSQPVHKCTEVANQLRHQSWVYVDTADQLVHLARQTLQQAAIPNLTLAPAIDVLSTGSYPRLPTCIKDKIIPTPPLPLHHQNQAYSLLDAVIRQRLSLENTHHLSVTSIAKGRVVLKIPYEFEVTLTVVGDDFQLPWRLLNCEILVGQSFPGSPNLIHSHHKHFLHQLTQSRLCSDDSSLGEISSSLHYFCLALQLDCLHAQAERLSTTMCGVYVTVDEYSPGHQMKVAYWRASGSSHFLSEFLLNEYKTVSWPKVVITVDPLSPDKPFSTSHYPPLPGGDGHCVTLDRKRLCLEDLLSTCVRIRSLALLRDLSALLRGSVWEGRSAVIESPLCLRVDIPISSYSLSLSTMCTVLLSVDGRVGQVTASLQCTQPRGWGPLVKKVMIEMERGIITNKLSLLDSLPSLQCALFLAHVSFIAADNGLLASHSIPLFPSLKSPSPTLYIGLRSHAYLIVSVKWESGELQDSYQLLQTTPTTLPSQPHALTTNTLTTNTPFLSLISRVMVDPANLLQLYTGSVTVCKCNMKLKRKLLDMNPCLPSNKRLCLSPSSALPVLGGVLDTQLSLLHLHQSLQNVGISAVADHHSQYGSRCISIFKFPPTEGIAGALLSSRLLSCQLWLSSHGYCYKMVFSSSSPIVLHREIPAFSPVGEKIVSDWRDKVMLYSLTQELQTYLTSSDQNALTHSCSIVEYTYERLLVRYHSHEVSVLAKGEGLAMTCSARSPHHFLLGTLQQFLRQTQSLPLLLQGMSLTVEAATALSSLLDRSPELMLSGILPSLVQLTHSNVHLTMRLMCEGEVSLCGLSYSRSPLTAVITHTTLHWILQMFIERHVNGDKSSSFDLPPPPPVDTTNQRTLIPSPVPIPSPHLSSPLPSLPSLPPPASVSISSQSHLSEPAWEHTITSSQLHTLLHPPSSSALPPLHSLLGSLNLLLHFVHHSAQDKLHQLQFVSVSHGSYHYRTDSISLSLSMNNAVSALKLSLNPSQEGMWSSNDLDTVTEFFYDQVSCPPYNVNAMTSFMRLLALPVQLLKSCVHIMALHLRPPSDAVWKIQLCLTVPEGSDLLEIASPNNSAVIFRGKLLLFFRLVRHSDGVPLVLPILHDPKSNLTYVARRQQQQQQQRDVLQAVDHILRHSSSDHSLPHEPALFPRIRNLLYSNIPL